MSVQALKVRLGHSWSWNPPAVAFSRCPPQRLELEAGAWGALRSGRGAAPLLPFHFPCAVAEAWALPPGSRQVPTESCPVCP